MRASPGDRLLVKERHKGEGDREALIIEVWSEYGRPPYVVRWHDGRQNVFFPASADTLIAGGPRGLAPLPSRWITARPFPGLCRSKRPPKSMPPVTAP